MWILIVLLLSPMVSLAGDEKWADDKAPIPEGCIFWLDAARQPAAWQANNRQPLLTAAKLDVWYDGSGNGLHFMQRVKDAQPQFVQVGDRAAIRFDGKDDFLELNQLGRSLEAFTAFIVASPRSNAGGFRAFLAAHEAGKNDYTTGFTIDMAGFGSDRFSQLNVEGSGFGGAVNLIKTPISFGEFHLIDVTCQSGEQGVSLAIDGQPAGNRRRDSGRLRLDALSLGARCYSNSAEPPFISGFLEGDIAEVLLFDRVLRGNEVASLRKHLMQKHAGLTEAIASADRQGGRLLKPIDNPPPVQMLTPGFTVRELPIELTNVNNVRYRADGKLFAVAYDGNIYLLSDTDGDGLEDRADPFWVNNGRLRGPIGMALTPPGYEHGSGLFIASKGKLSLIVDTDGDNRADREIVVASGWNEIPQNVDAIGVARARDGSIYFGLGTANYANAYLIDPQGNAQFDIKSDRGTILRVAPDFSHREIVCTGVRFPVSLAFNRYGDLFATDQEGATWLPNGNPFDELLHIQPGRHYGFPPRHPRYLSDVIDEPSVFDYGPQHQSTCGMFFNESVNGGASFGPAPWVGDAIVCGESRGKLFHTKLVKTTAGYVALNQTIACLGMLTVDACLSPNGDVVVSCHSGPPDWGTGPQGRGKLLKIHYNNLEAAQPVAVWPAGPQELRIEFDRPLDPTQLKNLARQVNIEFGAYVGAGDRFETLKPPYSVVERQSKTPRYDLPVYGAQVTANGRTLVLATARHARATHYAVTLPGIGRVEKEARGELRQVPAIDLSYELTGVTADWTAIAPESQDLHRNKSVGVASSSEGWSGWLPHMDLNVAREFTRGSGEHERLWPLLKTPGALVLRCQLDLWGMLRPAIQPGSSIDWTPPAEEVSVIFRSAQAFQIRAAGETIPTRGAGGNFVAELNASPRENEPLLVELSLVTSAANPQIEISWTTKEDSRPRAMPLRRFLLPWVTVMAETNELASTREIPELAGGDWLRGRAVFMSDELACSKCHSLRGHGGRIGPDLSNLPHRDYRSVLRDILEPSAAINPDHINYTVAMKDGRVLSGVPVASDEKQITLGDNTGKEISIARVDVDDLKPSAISAMPADIAKKLTAEQLRDLMTFLLSEPLEAARLERRDAPAPRRRQEIEIVLQPDAKSATEPVHAQRRLRIALVAGPKDHGPDEHDYPLWQARWAKLLALAENVEVSQASGWPTPEQLGKADVIAFYSSNPAWTPDRAADLDAFLNRGGGLVYIHFAVNGGNAVDALAERIGMSWGRSKFRHGPLDLTFTDSQHPITRGFDRLSSKVHFEDESYWDLVGDANRIHVLATNVEEGQPRPLIWSLERGRGRVFVSIVGHYTWTFDDPLFRILILRGLSWAAGEQADRFVELTTIGVRVEP
jgi:putative heme-binding domain-containing protein